MYKKRNYRRPVRKIVRRQRRKTAPRKKSMVKLIKSVIHRQAENKVINFSYSQNFGSWGQTNFNTKNVIPMTPYTSYLALEQGTSAGTRIGNRVTTRKLMFKFCIYPTQYAELSNPTPCPQEVTFYFVKCKDTPVSLTSTGGLANFFQKGATAQSPTGYLYDSLFDINKDSWTLLKKMKFKVGFASSSYGTGSLINEYFSNNDFKLNHMYSVDLTSICPKIIKFNDNSTTPTTPTVQLIILTSNADGSVQLSTTLPLGMYYQLSYEYEDM